MAFVKDGHFEAFKRDVELNHNALEDRIDQLENLIKKFNGGVTIEEVPDIEEVVEPEVVEEEEEVVEEDEESTPEEEVEEETAEEEEEEEVEDEKKPKGKKKTK
tara:strand:- start:510 stop:821 length:312 start_codon:yes stop_codon:yes gene_type:complete